eukprot:TRINITY_DN1888_c0_g1_i2.p1 TRINITY_DN1888_c0_g1~~TRINITY_DN1888_c0_g1_i2.p1  ORF type:complete len:397 (+),score=57.11 TRINITY_DN1888_c0_g1_i2:64-1254(+)
MCIRDRFNNSCLPFIEHPVMPEQNTTYHCGFYAFYNMICFINVLLGKDSAKQLKHFHRLHNRFSFWLFYKRALDSLVKELVAIGKTSDVENLLHDGPLERYEMQYLLDTNKKIHNLFRDYPEFYLKFIKIFFSFNHFQMASPKELVEIQDTFDEFLGTKIDGVLVVLLGIMTHWVVLVIHREKGAIKIYLLDSLAHEYLNTPQDQIPKNAQAFYEKRSKIKQKELVPYRIKMFTQLLTDLQIIYTIIYKMTLKQENLKQFHANAEIKIFWEEYETLFESFLKNLSIPLTKGNLLDPLKSLIGLLPTIPLEKKNQIGLELYKWLLVHKPKSLRDGIMPELKAVGAKSMSSEWRILMIMWMELQKVILENCPVPEPTEKIDPDNLPKKSSWRFCCFFD